MEITREFLDEELAGMRPQIQQYQAMSQMAAGGVQVLEQLRARLDEPETEPEEEPDEQDSGHSVSLEGDCGDGGEPEAAEGHDA